MDAKKVVAYVLMGSALGLVFFVFFLVTTGGEDIEDSTIWARGTSFTGVIHSISDERVSLELKENDVRDFGLDAGTRWILTHNRPLDLGTRVRIICREARNGGTVHYVARKIVAVPAGLSSPEASPSVASPWPTASLTVMPSGFPSSVSPLPSASPFGVRAPLPTPSGLH